MSEETLDPELESIRATLAALQPLEDEARRRVVAYVLERFGINPASVQLRRSSKAPDSSSSIVSSVTASVSNELLFNDIRSLKEAKVPETAVEMAILVAYYLSELAPLEERKIAINTEDLQIYFKQAKFPLPRGIKDVLPNAKKGGFMLSLGQGEYKLNSVGYNLAVHGLPKK